MIALVTGSQGFLGHHFTEALRARAWDVDGWDIADGRDCLYILAGKIEYSLVVHCAARSPHRAAIDGDPTSHIYNRMLDATMFDWAVRTATPVLYLSSCAVLSPIPDGYSLAKASSETMAQHARAAGLKVTVVRPYSGYGEDQSEDFPFGAFAGRARRREDPFELWNADAVRDWIHVDDIVNGALAVMESGTEEPVSLCTGIGTSCGDLAMMMAEAAGYRPTFLPRDDKPAGDPYRVGDPTLMRRYYTPQVTLEEGVKRALC